MSHKSQLAGRAVVWGVVMLLAATVGRAQQQIDVPSDDYDELFDRYVQAARVSKAPSHAVRPDWMAGLAGDFRARHINDLVTIRVVENIVAVGSADSNLTKKSTGMASLTKFFGLETKLPSWIDPTGLVDTANDTSFAGGGVTNRKGVLSAIVTARVAEVLPSGDLVLEGIREIDINGDRQMAVLTGIVRASDIGPSNVVLSTAVGQLRIRYFGRGLIKDNLKPGFLVRILNKIF